MPQEVSINRVLHGSLAGRYIAYQRVTNLKMQGNKYWREVPHSGIYVNIQTKPTLMRTCRLIYTQSEERIDM